MSARSNYFNRLIAATLASVLHASTLSAADLEAIHTFDIKPQKLESALIEFSQQADMQVIGATETLSNLQTRGVNGRVSSRAALTTLLESTPVAFNPVGTHSVQIVPLRDRPTSQTRVDDGRIHLAQATTSSTDGVPSEDQRAAQRGDERVSETHRIELEEIIVTGSHIRGAAQQSSPLTVYDKEEIKRSGATSVDQFFRTLPQNFNAISATGSRANASADNPRGVDGIDLRGLGVGTTLVLLNGRRIAPSFGGKTADLSLIPLNAVERVEILTDGASAIYGSDAVGGVVNFILKDDFDGAETTIAGSTVTDGGLREFRGEQAFGQSWGSGNALVSLGYTTRSELAASDRNFSRAAARSTLIPEEERGNAFISLAQHIGEDAVARLDALYSSNSSVIIDDQPGTFGAFGSFDTDDTSYFTSAGVSWRITDSLTWDANASFSTIRSRFHGFFDIFGCCVFDSTSVYKDQGSELTTQFSGELFELPGGAFRYSLGGGATHERFRPQATAPTLERDTTFVYGEVYAPLIGREQRIAGINRLELSIAGRWTDYSDFGENVSPKYGLLWAPVPTLAFRGTYGESFRAPHLTQLDRTGTAFILGGPNRASFPFNDIWSADDSTIMLYAQSENPNLQPETATSYTIGFDWEPAIAKGFKLSTTYFNIDYTDRIGAPAASQFAAFSNPQLYPELFVLNPTAAQIAAVINPPISPGQVFVNEPGVDLTDFAAVAAVTDVLFDNRLHNLAVTKMDGVDLGLSMSVESGSSVIDVGGQATYILDYTQAATPQSVPVTLVNTLLHPVDLKLNAFVGLARGGLSSRLSVNYVDGYENREIGNASHIASWTTFDFYAAYAFTDKGGLLSGMTASLGIKNLFDKAPPHIPLSIDFTGVYLPVHFDSTNADPTGRLVTAQITKRW